MEKIKYLGHVISKDRVKPDKSKIEANQKYQIPQTVKQIKSFLGLVGYYRKFFHNEQFVNAFEKLKEIICNPSMLQYPDFSKPFNLTTDASNYALGAVLTKVN